VVLALWFRNEGPQQPVYEWLEEDENEDLSAEDEEAKKREGEN
jgi:hypothetical protein